MGETSAVGEVSIVFAGLSLGLREGSKLIILILGVQPSFESNPIAFAVRFLLRDGVDEEEGEDEDMMQ
jgi:hypothetical protein